MTQLDFAIIGAGGTALVLLGTDFGRWMKGKIGLVWSGCSRNRHNRAKLRKNRLKANGPSELSAKWSFAKAYLFR